VNGPVPRIDVNSLSLGDDLGNGGQGRVTAVTGLLADGYPAALKAYSQDTASSLAADVLETIVGFPRQLPAGDADWLAQNTAWPAMIAEDRGTVCGFLMRTVPAPYYFGFQTRTQGTQQKLAHISFLLNSDDYVSRSGLAVSDRDRLGLLSSLAAGLSRLHALGAVIGDLSPTNLLFTLQPAPGCFFIDCDTIRLHGQSIVPQVDTPDWEALPGEPRATPATDSYKLGLLAIRLFARDQSSGDPSALAAVSADLARLARLSQDPDPTRRPGPAAWTGALDAAASSASAATTTRIARAPGRISVPIPAMPSGPAQPQRSAPGRPAAPRPSWRVPVVALLCLLMAGIVATGIHFASSPASGGAGTAGTTGDGASAGPAAAGTSGSAAAQADQVNAILAGSAATRHLLQDAVNDVGSCTDLPSAAQNLQKVVSLRGTQLRKASSAATGALPSGAPLRSSLIDALQVSLRADRDFLTWAREMETGCTYPAPQTRAYKAGFAASATANSAKENFLQIWNPIATANGYPSRSPNGM
jgi:hypothetical protein